MQQTQHNIRLHSRVSRASGDQKLQRPAAHLHTHRQIVSEHRDNAGHNACTNSQAVQAGAWASGDQELQRPGKTDEHTHTQEEHRSCTQRAGPYSKVQQGARSQW
jgi:hypothetical protein